MISGIRRDTDDVTDDGALLAVNLRFSVDGEYRRRTGMEYVASYGADRIVSFMNPATGRFALLLTPSGTLEAVSL